MRLSFLCIHLGWQNIWNNALTTNVPIIYKPVSWSQSKSNDCFLYERNIGRERVNNILTVLFSNPFLVSETKQCGKLLGDFYLLSFLFWKC